MAKESNLTINTSMDDTEYVRVVIGGSSRRITLENLINSADTALAALGYQKNTGLNRPVTAITGNYVATSANSIIQGDCTSNNITVTLPAITDMWDATNEVTKVLTIKKVDTSATYSITINPPSGENIDNTNNVILTGADEPSATVYTDGTEYWTI